MGHVDALSRCHANESTNESADVCFVGSEEEVPATPEANVKLPKDVPIKKPMAKEIGNCQMVATVDADEIDSQLQVMQNRDPTIVGLRQRLQAESMSEYELANGLVYQKDGNRRLVYVPAELEGSVIRMVHEKVGHQSVDKCCEGIKRTYWFPGMRAKVEKFIRNCLRCIMHSPPVRISEHNLFSIPKRPVPFDIAFGSFRPLPALISKRKHILAVVDAFTKYVKLYPTNSTSTREVIASLDKYFAYYGRPRRVITDRGTCFTSSEFGQYLLERNIVHVKVATASPQANGQVERVNRVLKAMLAKLSEPINHSDWSGQLSRVEHAMNNSVHRTTKRTPSMMLFGVEQRGEDVEPLTEYLMEMHADDEERDLERIRAQAATAIEASQ